MTETNDTRIIIGLSGYAGTGKDTLAKRLIEEHGFRKIAFADSLRQAVLTLDPFVRTNAGELVRLSEVLGKDPGSEAWDKAKKDPEVRRLLQCFGTELMRNLVGPNVWVDLANAKIRPEDKRIVFTDCRFPNELEAIASLGGQLWKIQRPGFGPLNAHASETSAESFHWDAVISNSGTIQQLWNTVDYFLREPAVPSDSLPLEHSIAGQ